MRALPGLGLLLVAFGAGIRTDDLGGIGRKRTVRGKTEDRQQAAEIEARYTGEEPGLEPDRPEPVRSEGR